jgi:hypothetical protein
MLWVRAPLAPEATPPASVGFRATAVLGMALALVFPVLLALDWRPPVTLESLLGTASGPGLAEVEVAPERGPEKPRAVAPACDSRGAGPTRLPSHARSVP